MSGLARGRWYRPDVLVYGDPSERCDLSAAWRAFARRLERSRSASTDELTELTVAAGQLEQATHDALAPSRPASASPVIARAHALTRELAAELVHSLDGARCMTAGERVASLQRWLGTPPPQARQVRWKLPEGLAFYDLEPAAFVAAAEAWRRGPGAGAATALVLGVRSIGTTLGAVVAAALRHRGVDARCETVRPVGPPFAREVDLTGFDLPRRIPVLIVDEGPGLSGSSLAAVARAVHAAGLEPPSIALLPSHAADPGPMAPVWVRDLWSALPRFVVTPGAETRGRRLDAVGSSWAARPGGPGAPPRFDPRPCRRFARPWHSSVRAVARFGGVASVLDGSGELRSLVEAVGAGLAARAAAGFGPPVLGAASGYVVNAVAPGPASAALPPASVVTSYLVATAGAPLDRTAAQASLERARDLLTTNAADFVVPPDLDRLAAGLRLDPALGAAATDYDLAEYHWRRQHDGAWWKLGGRGAAVWDHTAVGPQTLAWSLGSAVAEGWRPGTSVDDLLQATASAWSAATAAPDLAPTLASFAAAYAAFRRGQGDLCARICADPAEVSSARADQDRYAGVLGALASSKSIRR